MSESEHGIGHHGERVAGPPWILGHRGSPLEAPENTRASLRRALDLGLDGIEYDVRACQSGEILLLHDETLERTTDGHGPLANKSWVELAELDAGRWFDARFRGEPLALLEEVLDLAGHPERGLPQHMIVLEENGLVHAVAQALRDHGCRLSVRVASHRRDVCLEARDAGLSTMLLAERAQERDRPFVRDEHIAAYCTAPGGWRTEAESKEWKSERWSAVVDEPADLLEACRTPLNGFTTNEPLRALATRALVSLTPHDEAAYPLQTKELEVTPGDLTGGRGDWCGSWSSSARVRNPFPFRVRVVAGILPRRGAFDIEKLPASFALVPGAEVEVPYRLTGGSWRPGGDPLFFVQYRWSRGPGRAVGGLMLDAPLHRVRTTVADSIPRRLTMLREAPGDAPASMTLRRHRHHLLVAIENAGGLADARTVVHLDGRFFYGGRGVRAVLPEDFDQRERGIAFSCGMMARRDGEWVVRRFAGGVPDQLDAGAPGRILPLRHA